MQNTMELHIRRELEVGERQIERLREDPSRLRPELRPRRDEILAELKAHWECSRDAIDRLVRAAGEEAGEASRTFGEAWMHLQARLRSVCR